MAKGKNNLQKLVGKKIKLSQFGIDSGYLGTFTTGEGKVVNVKGNLLYIECAGYPQGYAVGAQYWDTKLCSTIEDFEKYIEELKEQKKEIDSEIENSEMKIKFIKEVGVDEFDEEVFKAFKILELMEKSKMTKIQKAKKISEIVKS